jgi:hypothetical protein
MHDFVGHVPKKTVGRRRYSVSRFSAAGPRLAPYVSLFYSRLESRAAAESFGCAKSVWRLLTGRISGSD